MDAAGGFAGLAARAGAARATLESLREFCRLNMGRRAEAQVIVVGAGGDEGEARAAIAAAHARA
ncbi:MAG: hypothetical protein EB824_00135 [Thaumarchaeota archaeon S15]|nr:MAG: hypothetical protein EB824_00135 [Thaumarchaeota archaeon S15]